MIYADPEMKDHNVKRFRMRFYRLKRNMRISPIVNETIIKNHYYRWNKIFEDTFLKISELLSKDEIFYNNTKIDKIIDSFIERTKAK